MQFAKVAGLCKLVDMEAETLSFWPHPDLQLASLQGICCARHAETSRPRGWKCARTVVEKVSDIKCPSQHFWLLGISISFIQRC